MPARFGGFRTAIRAADGFGLTVTVLGAVAGVLMIVSELSSVASVDVAHGSCEVINDADPSLADRCSLSGLERHGGALILIGVLVLLMAWGAGVGGSRPAAGALLLAGALVLGIALVFDLPVTNDTGAIGRNFEQAKATAGPGFFLAIAAGVLALLAGLAGMMRRAGPAIAATLLLLLVLAAPAGAQDAQPHPAGEPMAPTQHVEVGIGDNRGAFFGDPRFDALGIRNVRLIVPYDLVLVGGVQLAYIDNWVRLARERGLNVLVSFGFSSRRRLRWHLPSVREYSARVREFMTRYPSIHEYTTWNEANHKRVQPTGLHPERTALLYRALRRLCKLPDCTALAADILLTGSPRTWRWIRSFKRRAGRGPHIWGIHNYPDANRISSARTRRFLRTVRGEVWFTETGGIVHFGRFKRNERRAARAVHQVFGLAALSPRVKRIYLYSWRAVATNRRWDSGLLSATGQLRPAYKVLTDALALDRFNPRRDPPPAAEFTPLQEPASR
jgi:hypothetical protein